MKKIYNTPTIKVTPFESEDIMASSVRVNTYNANIHEYIDLDIDWFDD